MSARVAAIAVYPVKSCRGVAVSQAQLTATGLQWDRHWMVVDAAGRFITQRDRPLLATVVPHLSNHALELTAPGMPALSAALDQKNDAAPCRVKVWQDDLAAWDQGNDAAQWISKVLHTNARLVRFMASERRISNTKWTGDIEACNQFSDGFPLLAIGENSLVDLNRRLVARNAAALPMDRFRPNLVLSGLEPYEEDRIHELQAQSCAGPVVLRVVKPCTRCKITAVDQEQGVAVGDEPLATLKTYRWDAELRGVTFGQNVVLVAGCGATLSVGQELTAVRK
jgi:uncharacterized protein